MPTVETTATTENSAGAEQLLHDFCMAYCLPFPLIEQPEKPDQRRDCFLVECAVACKIILIARATNIRHTFTTFWVLKCAR